LSQTQLAELLDTTRKMIDYYERRAGNPSLDFIQRAAEALDGSVAELLGSQSKATRGSLARLHNYNSALIRSDVSLAKNRSSFSASSILS
jgi:transcriptional regulator with XRE-family HTH domain